MQHALTSHGDAVITFVSHSYIASKRVYECVLYCYPLRLISSCSMMSRNCEKSKRRRNNKNDGLTSCTNDMQLYDDI